MTHVAPNRLLKKYFLRGSLTAAAKAGAEKKPLIAALKRSPPKIKREIEFFRSLLSYSSFSPQTW